MMFYNSIYEKLLTDFVTAIKKNINLVYISLSE
jgi:hypothetical protein